MGPGTCLTKPEGWAYLNAHGDSLARIELPEKERRLFWDGQLASTAARRLRELGFRHITLDLEGYSRGSMNEPS